MQNFALYTAYSVFSICRFFSCVFDCTIRFDTSSISKLNLIIMFFFYYIELFICCQICRKHFTISKMNIISLLIWMVAFMFNTPYLLNSTFTYVKPLKDNFCYLTTWRLVFIDNIFYLVFLIVTLFIIPEMIMIYMTSNINTVRTTCEINIISTNRASINETPIGLDSEAVPSSQNQHTSSQLRTATHEIITMQVRNEQSDEIEMTKEERVYFTNLLRLKSNYLKLIISLLLCFVFSSLLTQIQFVLQKFGVFVDYQYSPEYKLFILLSVFLIYSICSINCVIFLFYSQTLRTHSWNLLERIIFFYRRS